MNDYLKTKELYHFGIKGMRWGIRKGPAQEQESEYNKASKSRIEKAKVLGGVGGALAGTAVGISAAYLFNRGRVFVSNGKKFSDKYTGESLKKVKKKTRKLISGTAFIGSVAGLKIMTNHAKQKIHEEKASRLKNSQENILPNK